jgi:membrane dipeptidase
MDAHEIVAKGKKVVYLSIENAYPLGLDASNLREFYDLGVRMLGLVHNRNNQFADSSTDPDGPKWNGLSPLGIELVREANKLGIIIDASHAHDLALEQMISFSTTPVVLSHSGSNNIFEHPRNVSDSLLIKLKESGGVIQMNSLGGYLRHIQAPPERKKAFGSFVDDINAFEAGGRPMSHEEFIRRQGEIDHAHPLGVADFSDYMVHFKHVLELVGTHHVGIGADWDGGGGVIGMMDVSDLPKLTERLLHSGYTESDLERIWSGNLLRLLRMAENGKD